MEEQYLQEIADLLYDAIYDQLNVKYRSEGYYGGFKRGNSPRIASKQMINSLSVEVIKGFEDGDPIIAVFFDTDPDFLPRIINDGRKPGPVGYLGLENIKRWMKAKPIYWRNERGRFTRQSEDSKAFLIARSIREKGYKGIKFLEKAENQVMDELILTGQEAAAQYFEDLIVKKLVILA